jgi:hypothetical protein
MGDRDSWTSADWCHAEIFGPFCREGETPGQAFERWRIGDYQPGEFFPY